MSDELVKILVAVAREHKVQLRPDTVKAVLTAIDNSGRTIVGKDVVREVETCLAEIACERQARYFPMTTEEIARRALRVMRPTMEPMRTLS